MNMRDNLADIYQAAGRTALALKLLDFQESTLKPDHPDTQKTRVGLMRRCYQWGLFDRALPHYLHQYRSSLAEHGPRHIDTILAKRNLAEVYAQLRRYDEAEPLFLESLADLADRSRNDPIVVLTARYLANMYEAREKSEAQRRNRLELDHRPAKSGKP